MTAAGVDRFSWLRHARTLLYDAYWPPFHPRLDYDAGQGMAIARDLGADAIRFGTCGKWALYPSRVMPPHPDLGGRDLLQETIAAARTAGVKVIAYLPVGHGLPGVLVHGQRPQWAFVLDDGGSPPPLRHFGAPALVPVCPFGPYREDILAMAAEVVEGYEVDGLYLDGPYYGWIFAGICQCPSCRTGFRAATGLELPGNAEASAAMPAASTAERLRRHRDWVAQGLVGLIDGIRAIARRRDLPLLFNGCVAEYLAGPWQQAVVRAADGFLLESHRGGIKGVGLGHHLGRMVWNYTHRHNCWNRRSTPEVEEDNALAGRLAVAQGAAPIVSYAGRFFTTREHAAPVRRLFAEMAAVGEAARGTSPAAYAAVVAMADLQPTEGWAKEARRGQDAHLYAMSAMLRSAGVQQIVLPGAALDDVDRLRAFPVVVLAGAAELSAAAIAGLRAHVAGGGGLVVTGATPSAADGGFALGDLLGADPIQPDAPLADLLAAHRWDQVDAPWDIYLQAAAAAPAPLPRHLLAQGEFRLVAPRPGTAVLAHLVLGADGRAVAPGMILNRCGRGRVVYIPSAIEATWASPGVDGRDRGLAGLVAAACELAAGRPPPYRLDGPHGVFANLMERPGLSLLHLVDEAVDREQVRMQVAVRLPHGAAPASIVELVSGAAIPFTLHDGQAVTDAFTWSRYACLGVRP